MRIGLKILMPYLVILKNWKMILDPGSGWNPALGSGLVSDVGVTVYSIPKAINYQSIKCGIGLFNVRSETDMESVHSVHLVYFLPQYIETTRLTKRTKAEKITEQSRICDGSPVR